MEKVNEAAVKRLPISEPRPKESENRNCENQFGTIEKDRSRESKTSKETVWNQK